jgi:hypothetical protein
MRRTLINKYLLLFLLSLCFFSCACGQTEAEKIAESYKFKDKALELQQKNAQVLFGDKTANNPCRTDFKYANKKMSCPRALRPMIC